MFKKKQYVEIWYGFYFEGDEYYAFEQRSLPRNFRKISVGQILPMRWDNEIWDAQCILIGDKEEVDQLIDDLISEERTYLSLNMPPFKAVSKRKRTKRKLGTSDNERDSEIGKRNAAPNDENVCESNEENAIKLLDGITQKPIEKSGQEVDGKNVPENIEEDGDNICEYLEIEGENVHENFEENDDQIHDNLIQENGESTLEWNGDDSLEFDDSRIERVLEDDDSCHFEDAEYAEICKRFTEAGRYLAAVKNEVETVEKAYKEIRTKLQAVHEEKREALRKFNDAKKRMENRQNKLTDDISHQAMINLDTIS